MAFIPLKKENNAKKSKTLTDFLLHPEKYIEGLTMAFDKQTSYGGLVVELWTDNSLPSATVGSNLR